MDITADTLSRRKIRLIQCNAKCSYKKKLNCIRVYNIQYIYSHREGGDES
jgi:hypothetical protein